MFSISPLKMFQAPRHFRGARVMLCSWVVWTGWSCPNVHMWHSSLTVGCNLTTLFCHTVALLIPILSNIGLWLHEMLVVQPSHALQPHFRFPRLVHRLRRIFVDVQWNHTALKLADGRRGSVEHVGDTDFEWFWRVPISWRTGKQVGFRYWHWFCTQKETPTHSTD